MILVNTKEKSSLPGNILYREGHISSPVENQI